MIRNDHDILLDKIAKKTFNPQLRNKSALIEHALDRVYIDHRARIRDEIKTNKANLARLYEEFKRLFPDEDVEPEE